MESQKRKKWTAIEQPDDEVLRIREKRKWQIALRRYIIEEHKCLHYAPYFGLDIKSFRLWIENQFTNELNWANFSKKWQFDHVIPVNYFDFSVESDLKLCWHFINIRVSALGSDAPKADLLTAKQYFGDLLRQSGFQLCRAMLEKIETIQAAAVIPVDHLSRFITAKQDFIHTVADFTDHEFDQLNQGIDIDEVLAERALLRNFG